MGVLNLVRIEEWQLGSGSRVLGADRLLAIENFGGILVVKFARKPSGSLGIARKLLVALSDGVRCGRWIGA